MNFIKDDLTSPNLVIHLKIDESERQKLRVKQITGTVMKIDPQYNYYQMKSEVRSDEELNLFDFFSEADTKVLRLESKANDNAYKTVVNFVENNIPVFNFSNDKEVEAKVREEILLIQKRREIDVRL